MAELAERRELGELLRVVRYDSGAPIELSVAAYPLTREPAAFADTVA